MSNAELFARAQDLLPGGVNSPVRAYKSVGGTPVFVSKASGPYVWDEEGTRYVDYVGAFGPAIAGHAHPAVTEAIQIAAQNGITYGAPTRLEIEFAERVRELVPSMQMMRATSSGTEAVMGALRVARGFTGRDLVIKFEGCYHGGADYLLVQAGSGLATFGVPTSRGVPAAIASTTLVLPYNDLKAVAQALEGNADKVAAIILEPVVGNMGVVAPAPGFLPGLRDLCTRHGALLVFDEVMSGFRVARGGAQARYGVTPDLSCFGKIVGGGTSVGVYGGRKDVMASVSPLGGVYQAGTNSGNPIAMRAGLAMLTVISQAGFYERLETTSAQLEALLTASAKRHNVTCAVQRVGSMLTPFFGVAEVRSWEDAKHADTQAFARFFQALRAHAVLWPPSQFEAAFVSSTHDADAMEVTERAVDAAMQAARG